MTKARWPSFDGEGARLHGGRWNPPGIAIIYTAGSFSLAILEFFVNLDPNDPPALAATEAEVPDDVRTERIEADDLPSNWRISPAPPELANLGAAWVRRNTSAVLQVPSAIVPQESNYLLNPAHPDFARVTIGNAEPFTLDPRMLK